MSKIIRHQGVVRSTGSRVFVLWRHIPDDINHCLVIYRDSIPEVYMHTVNELVMNQGQKSVELWEVMDKVGYLDNRKMLDVLHNLGYIRKQRTCDIDMHVGGGAKVALDELNASILEERIHQDGKVKDFNPFDANAQDSTAERGTIVDKLIADAEQYLRLHEENLERAYNIDPSRRPVVEAAGEEDDTTFSIVLEKGVSQAKAIEIVKKALAAQKAK
ncbi:hypothetical protein EJP02_215 [Escherichia phage EJP2]|mgnify:CR=1 FL=1|nr:hypothetical protein EJP02_215 [Escherichia phage EJP2]